jgi:hypothetical protein
MIADLSSRKRGVKDDGSIAINGLTFAVQTVVIVINTHHHQLGISLLRTAV